MRVCPYVCYLFVEVAVPLAFFLNELVFPIQTSAFEGTYCFIV